MKIYNDYYLDLLLALAIIVDSLNDIASRTDSTDY